MNNFRAHRRKPETPARFPFGKMAILLATVLVGVMVIYRLSEATGKSSQAACVAAMTVSGTAAVAGIFPLCNIWGRELTWGVLSIFFSGLIRLLVGFSGVVVTVFFTGIDRVQFVSFLGLFYAVFLATDIQLAIWVLRQAEINQDENGKSVIRGTIWDIAVKH